MKDYQMLIDHFNPDIPPRCNKHYPLNGFFKNCFFCPYTLRNNGTVSCRLSGKKITTREKYALTAWKKLRENVLTRDNQTCVICGTREHLHIHHMDSDNTRDDPENLVTLCNYCHARAHRELKKDGGMGRVMSVLGYYRSLRVFNDERGI